MAITSHFSTTPNMRGQHVYGNDSVTHERSFGLDQSATPTPSPIKAANHHAAYLRSWAERGE